MDLVLLWSSWMALLSFMKMQRIADMKETIVEM